MKNTANDADSNARKVTVVSVVETKLGSGTMTDIYVFSTRQKAIGYMAEFILAEGEIGREILNEEGEEYIPIPRDLEAIKKLIIDAGDSDITVFDEEDDVSVYLNIIETTVDEKIKNEGD